MEYKELKLGEKIKKLRILNRYSLRKFGELIGKDKSTISRYESNDVIPDIMTIFEMAKVFNIDVAEFLDLNKSSRNEYSKNPFDSEKLYLYYIGFKDKLVVSELNITNKKFGYEVIMKNAISKVKEEVSLYVYNGIIESNGIATFITLSNYYTNPKFERVQITINNQTKIKDCYYGTITATRNDNFPTIRKCMICTKDLRLLKKEEKEEIYNKLKVTKDEIDYIKKHNFWDPELRDTENVSIDIN